MTSRGRGWRTFRRLSAAARSSEMFAQNTHFSGLTLAVGDVKNTHRAFHALNAPTRVTGYVDRPPHRPRLAAVCRGLTAHRPPWPTVIVRWLERIRQRRNMHTAALSSVLRVSARAKPRTEWLGGRVRAGPWWAYGGVQMCSRWLLQSSPAMALGPQSSRKSPRVPRSAWLQLRSTINHTGHVGVILRPDL